MKQIDIDAELRKIEKARVQHVATIASLDAVRDYLLALKVEQPRVSSNEPSKYDSMTVLELRKICNSRNIGTGVWRVGASKADLIARLVESDGQTTEGEL